MSAVSNTSAGQDASSMVGAANFGLVDPTNVNLNTANLRDVTCYILAGSNEYNGNIGVRISAVFVILIVSTAVTFFPVMATRMTRFKIPLYVYLFARYFGAGVIVATAFIHLLDPAYDEIGPASCVGMTGGWVGYSWPPAIALSSAMITFLMEFAAERYVEKIYDLPHAVSEKPEERARHNSVDMMMQRYSTSARHQHEHSHQSLHSSDQHDQGSQRPTQTQMAERNDHVGDNSNDNGSDAIDIQNERLADIAFRQQITAFLILEFGVLFHSVIISLALGTAGNEFSALYPVIVFHQSFEGLGIGARLSAIPFPCKLRHLPWYLCTAYGLTTPIAICAALGVRATYNAGSYTANVVSGVLDATSAGILIYTGFVELIARDFLFNAERPDDDKQLSSCSCPCSLEPESWLYSESEHRQHLMDIAFVGLDALVLERVVMDRCHLVAKGNCVHRILRKL